MSKECNCPLKYGRLEVLGVAEAQNGRPHLKCECGKIVTVDRADLHSGNTKSCGCLHREITTTHGMTKTSEYNTWKGIIQRCTNLNNPAHKDYGGRGITVCPEWLHSFENFFKDMGVKPIGFTIERTDNDLGYSKKNCIWATRAEQQRNQRINKHNKTGIRGVSWSKLCQKYRVNIAANYKLYHIGVFEDLEDAKAARVAAEQKYWGAKEV